MFDLKPSADDLVNTPIKQQFDTFINDDDPDIIILNDDDLIQAISLFNNSSNHHSTDIKQIPTTINDTHESDLLIDLTDDFDLNDLFLIDSESIKNEFKTNLIKSDDNESELTQQESFDLNSSIADSNKNALKCLHCGKCFNKSYNYKRHLLQHETTLSYECPNCKRKILDKSNYTKHLKLCCNISPIRQQRTKIKSDQAKSKTFSEYQCSLCFKTFNKKFNYVRHLKVHSLNNMINFQIDTQTNEDFFQCTKCSRCFVEQKQLNSHFMKWHQADLTCTYCKHTKLVFNEKIDYIKHLNTFHSYKFEFKCKYCSKTFRYLSHYQEHKSLHELIQTSNLSYQTKSDKEADSSSPSKSGTCSHQINQCNMCGKKFSKLYNLKRHTDTVLSLIHI